MAFSRPSSAILGTVVSKDAVAIPQNATLALFTVTGGRIALTFLLSEVTVAINNAANNTKYISTPTTGSALDICAVASIQAFGIGSLVGLPGEVASALRVASSGGGLAFPTVRLVIPIGTIGINCANATGTGSMKHIMGYEPIDRGARVAAA